MISMMVLQAFEEPSGVEWIVMGFSAAPAFSFLWMSILEQSSHTFLITNPPSGFHGNKFRVNAIFACAAQRTTKGT